MIHVLGMIFLWGRLMEDPLPHGWAGIPPWSLRALISLPVKREIPPEGALGLRFQESMTFSSPLAAPGSLSARLKRAPLEVSSAAFERGPRAVSLQVCPSYTPLGFSGDTLQLGKYALKE